MKSKLKKLLKNRKGALGLGDIYPAVLTFVMIGIVLGIGIYVLAEVGTEIAANVDGGVNSTAYEATNNTVSALGTFSDWFGIIIIVLAAAIILGLVMRSFRQ